LGESDEKPFRPADVAEPIRVFILDYFAYELRADVVHGEHDAEVAEAIASRLLDSNVLIPRLLTLDLLTRLQNTSA
jgi:hypothetical protein